MNRTTQILYNFTKRTYQIVKKCSVFVSNLQTPERSRPDRFCPEKTASERFSRLCGRPGRDGWVHRREANYWTVRSYSGSQTETDCHNFTGSSKHGNIKIIKSDEGLTPGFIISKSADAFSTLTSIHFLVKKKKKKRQMSSNLSNQLKTNENKSKKNYFRGFFGKLTKENCWFFPLTKRGKTVKFYWIQIRQICFTFSLTLPTCWVTKAPAAPVVFRTTSMTVSSLCHCSSCRLMFCRMLSSREASAACRSVPLTYCCDSHWRSDSGRPASSLEEPPPTVSWFP